MNNFFLHRSICTSVLAVTFLFGMISCDSSSDKKEVEEPEDLPAIMLSTSFQLDEHQVITSSISSLSSDQDITTKVDLTYNADSLLTGIIVDRKSENKTDIHTVRSEYAMEYDEFGRLVKAIKKIRSNNAGPIDETYNYQYETKSIFQYGSGRSVSYYLNEKKQIYSAYSAGYILACEYDDNGNVTKFEDFVKEELITYKYEEGKKNFRLGKGISQVLAIGLLKDCEWLSTNNCKEKVSVSNSKYTTVTKMNYEYKSNDYPMSAEGVGENFNNEIQKIKSDYELTINY